MTQWAPRHGHDRQSYGPHPQQPYRPTPHQRGHQAYGPPPQRSYVSPPPQHRRDHHAYGPPQQRSGRHEAPPHGRRPTWPSPLPTQRQAEPPPSHRQPEPRNGLGLAAFILGLVGLPFVLTGLTAPIAIVLGLIAIPLALAGLGRVRSGRATNLGMTVAGLVLGVLAVAGGITSVVVTARAVDEVLSGPTATAPSSAGGGAEVEGPLPIGETVDVDGLRITVANVDERTEDFTNEPLTCASATYENASEEAKLRNSLDWALQDPDGASVNVSIYTGDDALDAGPIAVGGRAEGVVCFESTGESGEHRVQYRAGLITEPTAEWTWSR
jgi:hypothetical protein